MRQIAEGAFLIDPVFIVNHDDVYKSHVVLVGKWEE
jgi:hypothetical protein